MSQARRAQLLQLSGTFCTYFAIGFGVGSVARFAILRVAASQVK